MFLKTDHVHHELEHGNIFKHLKLRNLGENMAALTKISSIFWLNVHLKAGRQKCSAGHRKVSALRH